MKEFEKWDKENVNTPLHGISLSECCKNLRREGWKAALEWVEENFDWANNGNNLSILLREIEGSPLPFLGLLRK